MTTQVQNQKEIQTEKKRAEEKQSKDKLLTLVIPSYNAEKTLKTTLDSLCVPELMEDLEILVVNDGSTDRTGEIAREYEKEYPDSIRLIDKENGGHGSGINVGIKEAAGEYLKVMDADDWAEKEGLAALCALLKEHRGGEALDLVSSQFLWAFDNGKEDGESSFQKKPQFKGPFEGVEYGKVYRFQNICERLYLKFHNLTYRTGLLREQRIVVDENCCYEDSEIALYPCLHAKTLAFTQEPLYMYRIGRKGQSMDPEKMARNEAHYRRVLDALLSTYLKERDHVSDSVCRYMENFIARFYAGYIKVLLLLPKGKEGLAKLIETENMLKRKYPSIYEANINQAVKLLRVSDYRLYYPAASMIRFRGTV